MARVPGVVRRRFFSGSPLDTLNLFLRSRSFSESVGPNCPHETFTPAELLLSYRNRVKTKEKTKKRSSLPLNHFLHSSFNVMTRH